MSRRSAMALSVIAGVLVVGSSDAASALTNSEARAMTRLTPRCSGVTWTYAGGHRDPGAGQVYTTVRLKNTSGRACRVRGYATVHLLGAQGVPLGPTTPDGQAARIITVPRAGTVHVVIHTNDPGVNPGRCSGPSATVTLTPPDTGQSLRIRTRGLFICAGRSTESPVLPGA
jgi:hypothetical protein